MSVQRRGPEPAPRIGFPRAHHPHRAASMGRAGQGRWSGAAPGPALCPGSDSRVLRSRRGPPSSLGRVSRAGMAAASVWGCGQACPICRLPAVCLRRTRGRWHRLGPPHHFPGPWFLLTRGGSGLGPREAGLSQRPAWQLLGFISHHGGAAGAGALPETCLGSCRLTRTRQPVIHCVS